MGFLGVGYGADAITHLPGSSRQCNHPATRRHHPATRRHHPAAWIIPAMPPPGDSTPPSGRSDHPGNATTRRLEATTRLLEALTGPPGPSRQRHHPAARIIPATPLHGDLRRPRGYSTLLRGSSDHPGNATTRRVEATTRLLEALTGPPGLSRQRNHPATRRHHPATRTSSPTQPPGDSTPPPGDLDQLGNAIPGHPTPPPGYLDHPGNATTRPPDGTTRPSGSSRQRHYPATRRHHPAIRIIPATPLPGHPTPLPGHLDHPGNATTPGHPTPPPGLPDHPDRFTQREPDATTRPLGTATQSPPRESSLRSHPFFRSERITGREGLLIAPSGPRHQSL